MNAFNSADTGDPETIRPLCPQCSVSSHWEETAHFHGAVLQPVYEIRVLRVLSQSLKHVTKINTRVCTWVRLFHAMRSSLTASSIVT
jgi:hypothetical protein